MTTEKKANPWQLALTAIGIVDGDIGTSPLYAFSIALHATGSPVPTPGDVLGIVSLIFWAIMLMVSLKYVVFVLRADNDGDGGKDSDRDRRFGGNRDVDLASRLIGGAASVVRHVDAACQVRR
jgi:hypothetical protein